MEEREQKKEQAGNLGMRMPLTGEEKEQSRERLQKQYNQLLQEWNSMRLSRAADQLPSPASPSSSSSSACSSCGLAVLEGTGEWMVATNELAVANLIDERRKSMVSAQWKGKKLFADGDDGIETLINGKEDIRRDSNWEDENGEITEGLGNACCMGFCSSTSTSTSSSSFLCGACMERFMPECEEQMAIGYADQEKKGVSREICSGRRRFVVADFLQIVVVVCAVAIMATKLFDDRGNGNEMVLVPT